MTIVLNSADRPRLLRKIRSLGFRAREFNIFNLRDETMQTVKLVAIRR